MKKNDYIKKIEQLNLEIINLKKGKEYSFGKNYIKTKEYLKELRITSILKKIIQKKKISKLNDHEELENNFSIINDESLKNKKIAIYTCVTGNYDKEILEPFIEMENVDFIFITDNLDKKSEFWQIKPLPENINQYDNVLKNRYIKMHPKELFPEYDYSIYIDGNVQVISDITDLIYSINSKTGLSLHRHQFRNCIYKEVEACGILKRGNYKWLKEQAIRYEEEGFPKEYGLLECNIIVTDLKSEKAKKILDSWWKEFTNSKSLRDQIALPYVLWKNNLGIEDIGNLGYNVYKNPKFRLYIH